MSEEKEILELEATRELRGSAPYYNRDTWWGKDATIILDYIEMYRGSMSDFEVLEDIMCGSYVHEPDLYIEAKEE